MGTIDVSQSSTVSAVIGGIPFGAGYQISLRGTTTDGRGVCMGSATFDVSAPGTKTVPVHLTCDVQPNVGSISVNGQINVCPRIDGVTASPGEVAFGGSISLVGHGRRSRPRPVADHLQLDQHVGDARRRRHRHADADLQQGRHGDGDAGRVRR